MDSDEGSSSQTTPELEDVSSLDRLPLHSTDLLTLLDPSGVVLYESPSIERLYGYDQEELVGEQVAEYFHPEDRDRVVEAFAAIVSEDGQHVETVEYRHLMADGSYRWIESVGSSDPTPDGNYVINSRDISERKQRERALQQTREQVQSERDGKEAIRQLLLQTSTDTEIAASVCRLLVDDYGYEAAWVVRKQGTQGDDPHPVVIADHGSDWGFRRPDEDGSIDAATRRTLTTDDPVTVTMDADEEPEIGAQLEQCGLTSVRSVPLDHEGLSYGALTVVRTDAGSPVAGQLVDEVAAALAFKQRIHRQQEALASETVTELTLRYSGEHVLTALSRALAAQEYDDTDGDSAGENNGDEIDAEDDSPEVVVEELQGSDGVTFLLKTADVDAETLRATATGLPSVRTATVVTESETRTVVSIRTDAGSIRELVGGHGEVLRSITARDGRLELIVEFPRRTDLGAIVDAVQDHWPEATMHACTERTVDDDHPSAFSGLTIKQEDALRAASLAGFFERPQEASAEDVAATLGSSASTFLHHLRNAERAVFEDVFSHDGRLD
ncbi:bacterio-opsin activator domain-containing protein [Halorientalis marina]|uniref:bacterio-opsin activator domain-containing protein n=1 Tax=Halorientalis marina TaxID=2931976 RepID=UPI001FF190A6|nr:bacterio-opsin activator domain-containing protein [Halorientalis marina]